MKLHSDWVARDCISQREENKTIAVMLSNSCKSVSSPYLSGLLPYLQGRKKVFYLMMHSTHFIYGYMALDIWLRTTQIARKETRCHNMGYSFRLPARILLYAPSHRQDSTYHGLCYTSRGALAGKEE